MCTLPLCHGSNTPVPSSGHDVVEHACSQIVCALMINGWPLFPGEDDEIREVQVCTSFVLLNRCTTREKER